jgi:hypothetical protein
LSTNEQNRGEALFEQYLAQRGYSDYEHHPDWLNPPKKPDYLIRTAFGEVVVEVKSFQTWGLLADLKDEPSAIQSLTETLEPVREAIKHAAKQLKGIRERPLIVVLDNPDNRIPLTDYYVRSAMYGELNCTIPMDGRRHAYWYFGRNARLYIVGDRGLAHGNHDYISAVAVIREGLSVGGDATGTLASQPAVTLDVFEAISERCVPLPSSLFAHDGDTRWGVLGPGMYGRRNATSASDSSS